MLIHKALIRSAQRAPENVALYFQDQKTTYAQLLARVKKLAAALRRLGLRKGARVALCLQNCPEFISAYYSVLYGGGIVVPINTFLVTAEIEHLVQDSQPQILITNDLFWERFEPILKKPGSPVEKVLFVSSADHPPPSFNRVQVEIIDFEQAILQSDGPDSLQPLAGEEDGLAELIYTSGTTGRPKGVMLSHRNLTSNTASVVQALEAGDQDIFLLLLPAFHITSQQACMLTPIFAGAGISVLEKIDRADLLYAMSNHRPTIFIAVPTIYNMLAQLPPPPPHKNPVRLYVSGGAPLPMEIYNRFEETYRKPIYQGYGLTEASPVVSWNIPGRNRPRSSGRALSGVRLKIVDDENRELPTGQIGEICVQGALVMMGYYNLPEATKETLVDDWLKTGDVGYLDEEGYLFLVDRKKEMLLYSGMNVYPKEVEEVLHEHPAVLESAVVGVEESAKGEIPIAFVTVQSAEALDVSELKEFCLSRLARYKVPRQFIPLEEMPETGSGKISKAELRVKARAMIGGRRKV